jgi:DNA repair exonuclease SbcCD ATPase subunit
MSIVVEILEAQGLAQANAAALALESARLKADRDAAVMQALEQTAQEAKRKLEQGQKEAETASQRDPELERRDAEHQQLIARQKDKQEQHQQQQQQQQQPVVLPKLVNMLSDLGAQETAIKGDSVSLSALDPKYAPILLIACNRVTVK